MAHRQILVVDDSAEVAFILGHIGRRAGWEIVSRRDAEQAGVWLQAHRPALVLLDVNLPGASGLECCRRLRAEPGLRELPVAMFSQWQRPEDIARALDAGADLIVSKELLARPTDCRERLDDILAWVGERRLPVQLRWDERPREVGPLVELFNQALRGPATRALGEEVVKALLARIVTPDELSWLAAGGQGLAPECMLTQASPEAVTRLVAAFAEQVWRVLGTGASVPVWRALGAEIPVGTECRSS